MEYNEKRPIKLHKGPCVSMKESQHVQKGIEKTIQNKRVNDIILSFCPLWDGKNCKKKKKNPNVQNLKWKSHTTLAYCGPNKEG